ncbi:MAG: flavin reductase [Oscillospiraceae bacterium]|nr:flavin reductase [Oscillospiraceae bacterium]
MKEFFDKSLSIFQSDWALVTAGSTDNCNTMTIGWGGLGTLWRKPVCTVYVKPCRYTHSFMDANDYFTVSFFGDEYRSALSVLGTKSGRDGNKIAEVGFDVVPCGESVTFRQAKTTLLCRKIYRQDLSADAMPADVIEKYYTEEAPHTVFIGEVIDIIE